MVWDLEETVPEVTRAFFETYLLPRSPLPEGVTPQGVVDCLCGLGKINKQGLWRGWKQPSQSTAHEDRVYEKFEFLAKDIVEAAAITDKKQTILFKCNPAFSLKSYVRRNTSKPDCYGIRIGTNLVPDPDTNKRQPRWFDVAVPGEFKKENKPESFNDNAKKVLWSMNHIVREDPERRSVIGFTIENASMRLWYCSRSDVFVSESFDMLREHDMIVDFVLRMTYATVEELGWDPSITKYAPSLSDGNLQYDVTVRDEQNKTSRTFRTKRIISNIGADALRGRGTRVWEVAELNDKGEETEETCVLKDSWVDEDRDREGKILAEIRAAAAVKLGPRDNELLDKSLLTVVTYGDVHVKNEPDNTRHKWKLPTDAKFKTVKVDPKATTKLEQSMSPVGAVTLAEAKSVQRHMPFSAKVHHRIVFKEVCTTIREVKSLYETFSYLREVVLALRCLHKLGWVHRDISSGNVLVFQEHAKLADLEYAKHESDWSVHGIRTGTPYFMSTEVDENDYLHTVLETPFDDDDDDDDDDNDGYGAHDLSSGDEPPQIINVAGPTVPFRHNPLHDLESMTWLSFFMLLAGKLVADGQMSQSNLDQFTRSQQALADELFTKQVVRRTVMANMTALRKKLSEAMLHPLVHKIAEYLNNIRTSLHATYLSAEKRMLIPIPFTVATRGLYKAYLSNFTAIMALLKSQDIAVAVDETSCDAVRQALCQEGSSQDEDPSNTAKMANEGPEDVEEGPSARPRKKQRTEDSRDCDSVTLTGRAVNLPSLMSRDKKGCFTSTKSSRSAPPMR